MDPITQQVVLATAGAAAGAGDATYVDDVFSTYLYEGNGGPQTITNGIDLSGEGGLVWVKDRENGSDGSAEIHGLFDTERGATKFIRSDSSTSESTNTESLKTFNSDGFTLGTYNRFTESGTDYVSWSFRKAPGFFDVVTYTGTGSTQNISHSLGSTPGLILIKCTSNAYNWTVWHRSLGTNQFLRLNATNGAGTSSAHVPSVSSTTFTCGGDDEVNGNNRSYVAYIFAHDDQSFGTDSDEAIIKCGSYQGSSSAGTQINLGFEPQFLLIKNIDSSGTDWVLYDNMRGLPVGGNDIHLNPNTSNAENNYGNVIELEATGFKLGSSAPFVQQVGMNGETYAYMAIRRPHKPPTAGTDVFSIAAASQYAAPVNIPCDFAPDFFLAKTRTGSTVFYAEPRLTDRWLRTNATNTEASSSEDYYKWDGPGGKINLPDVDFNNNPIFWQFRRAPGFFDVVAYTGTGTTDAKDHNLGVTPELLIVKNRAHPLNYTFLGWPVYNSADGASEVMQLQTTDASSTANSWASTSPTSTQFTVGVGAALNSSGATYVAYLFASLDGISKVGTYTGTGSAINVDCGFTAGARFVMIKRRDSTGDWYVWDTTRGIVSGNDPYLLLNSNAAQVTNTDYIDPLNAGFTVTSSAPAALNTSGGTYLFLAIA